METYTLILGDARRGDPELKASDLAKTLRFIGFQDIRVSPSARNAMFDSANPNRKMMEAQIRNELKYLSGVDAEGIVFSSSDFAAMAASHPLESSGSIDKLYATLLAYEPAPVDIDVLLNTMNGIDEHAVVGRVVYSYYGNGYEASRRSNEFMAKLLKIPAVTRNWAEMREIAALGGPEAPAIAPR